MEHTCLNKSIQLRSVNE
ncbi:hypothetical protein P5673_014749 [Acropora cervicornis]|uniref:Uncharacterized protein n=1 Tax=Acropora cervicornis TaxID=6130 RepID=A0AAD9QJE9_ACRCE|nr:hypothetical protein P5673_014749 [Acropora cervicornis]